MTEPDGIVSGPDDDPALKVRPADGGGRPQDAVDAVLRPLHELRTAPLTGHVVVFDRVHRGLQDVLASLDQD